jgi:hypothetical protein
MKVRVTYRSGLTLNFIVSEDILVVEFQQIAERLGGKVRKLEFPE